MYCFQRLSTCSSSNGSLVRSVSITLGWLFSLAAFFSAILESENPETCEKTALEGLYSSLGSSTLGVSRTGDRVGVDTSCGVSLVGKGSAFATVDAGVSSFLI